jgi:hypothetical protein
MWVHGKHYKAANARDPNMKKMEFLYTVNSAMKQDYSIEELRIKV